MLNLIHQKTISIEPAYISKEWIWAEMHCLLCLRAYTWIMSSQYFINFICIYDIKKISLYNWNQHIHIASVINWNICITDYVCLKLLILFSFNYFIVFVIMIYCNHLQYLLQIFCILCLFFNKWTNSFKVLFLFPKIYYLWLILYVLYPT